MELPQDDPIVTGTFQSDGKEKRYTLRIQHGPQYQEQCKHCGATRWAVPCDPYTYLED